jgi:hypothetical protein
LSFNFEKRFEFLSCASMTISENCSISGSETDFFSGIFENRPSKFVAVAFSGLVGLFLLPLVYSIIWYERFGSDNKRTLINKLVASLCWTCFEWYFSIQMIDMFRYIFGPLPHFVCVAQLHLKNAIFTQQMLFINGIIISRYIFIFWLKNPAAFQDDFWNLFSSVWIIGYSIISQIVSFKMPGRYTLYYYICTGKSSLADENIPLKSGLHMQTLSLVVFLSHLVVSIKLYYYRRRIVPKPVQQIRPVYSIEKESLPDLTTSVTIVLLSSIITVMIWKMNQIKMAHFNCYPNYLYEYFFRMIGPNVFSSTLVALHFHRNPRFRSTVKNEMINFLNK